jgi:hypothetical protein
MLFPRRSAFITACVAALLAIHFWLGVSATFQKSVTADETAHLTGGYSYWKFNDYRLQPENGNLPQRWAALPLLIEKPRLDPGSEPFLWSLSHVWLISQRFLFETGNNTDFMLATARACMALWSVATGLLVFVWSRRLWGDAAGLFSLSLYAFSATTLTHGPLVTSDMTVTFFLLAAAGAYWRHLERLTPGTLALSLAATGFAAVAKFSFLLLIPVFGLLLLWRWLETKPLPLSFGGQTRLVTTRKARAGLILASAALHILAAWFIIWLFFGFRFSAFAPGLPAAFKYYIPWEVVMPQHGFWQKFIMTSRAWHLLPDAYLQGFSYVRYAAEERSAFLNGAYSNTGWFYFFPYAFLVKTPLPELAAYAAALLAALLHWRKKNGREILADLRRVAPLLVLFGVYWAFSLTSHLNIGHRHILPVYPVLFILAGVLVRPAARWVWRAGAGALACTAAVSAFSIYPHYLAYFNLFAGGPDQGYRHLIDSSSDWGQDLPGIARWLRENQHPGEAAYISYFGMGDPRYEGITAKPLAPYYYHHRLRQWFELKPGIYCIGATLLQDAYSPWRGRWTGGHEGIYQVLLKNIRAELSAGTRKPWIEDFAEGDAKPLANLERLRFARLTSYLRLRRPDAIIGHSTFIYRLSAEEVNIVVDGSLEALAGLMERALADPAH